MLRSCAVGTEHLLQIAGACNATVVYASSAEIYGNPDVFPQREEYCGNVDPVGPRSPYEEGKRFGEAIVRLHAEKFLVETRIVRIFNTYGPGMSPGDTRVIPHFLSRMRQREKIIVYGDGKQTRTHLYVDDLIDALRLIAAAGTRGGVYNVGGEHQLTVLELADILRRLSTLPVEVEHRPHFIEDHGGRLPGIDKVMALGWRPRVSIEAGLQRMLESLDMPVQRLHGAAVRVDEPAPARPRVISLGQVREGRATR
jgi:dTDP-glucose 4,6-dehydratase/UDP-glucuronate decarboxylase